MTLVHWGWEPSAQPAPSHSPGPLAPYWTPAVKV